MLDVSGFLLRWLFLCNLVKDVADIQNLPYNPNGSSNGGSSLLYDQQQQQLQPSHAVLDVAAMDDNDGGVHWRDFYLRSISSYPPGMQRLLAMDALRIEVVHRLQQQLQESHNILRRAAECRRKQQQGQHEEFCHVPPEHDQYWDEDVQIVKTFPQPRDEHQIRGGETTTKGQEPDAVLIISDEGLPNVISPSSAAPQQQQQQQQSSFYVNSSSTAYGSSSPPAAPPQRSPMTDNTTPTFTLKQQYQQQQQSLLQTPPPSPEELEQARRALRDLHDYLPQLVSVVLKSPPPFEPSPANPITKLRQLVIDRCAQDANWGIEMCWLLEAEVGRAWKTLFEHRQQTGRRLIVVLPAEKAIVLAKIGAERREAFDLLQDVEQATAYGYIAPQELPPAQQSQQQQQQGYSSSSSSSSYAVINTPPPPLHHDELSSSLSPPPPQDETSISTRLPSSLSLRRCSHFGDTMQFVDRLTQISMDLRLVPAIQRHAYLQDRLHEMNRRLRRRMVTRGDVSLDVEDSASPDEWPHLSDLTLDMLKYSVHLPMEPKKVVWPSGTETNIEEETADNVGVVRILNIIVDESRLLASRERCPYLIHVEVADTALDGSDARLYASGATGLGTTIEEALGLGGGTDTDAFTTTRRLQHRQGLNSPNRQCPAYEIPPELLAESSLSSSISSSSVDSHGNDSMALQTAGSAGDDMMSYTPIPMPRGGWQADEGMFYVEPPDGGYPINPFEELVRQEEYELLHQQMQVQQEATSTAIAQAQMKPLETTSVTLGPALLDRVFGTSWLKKCEELRQSSAFGNVPGWRLASFIMKAGEDIRREALVMQVIAKLKHWFQTEIPEEHRPFMRPYTIMCVGGDAGIIECLSDAKSVDEIKKRTDGFVSLRDYFERAYGPPRRRLNMRDHNNMQQQQQPPPPSRSREAITFEKAQDNFLRSLVGYSLVCYILQIKDRHNANILMDREGHIMHIDFGFVLGDTPKMGKVPIFSERAPFKLSSDFWEVLGGWNIREGGLGVKFCEMFERAFACASSHADEIASLVEATLLTLCRDSTTAHALANGVRSRLRMRGPPRSKEQKLFVVDLVNTALTSWGTSTYDWLQKSMNGYQ